MIRWTPASILTYNLGYCNVGIEVYVHSLFECLRTKQVICFAHALQEPISLEDSALRIFANAVNTAFCCLVTFCRCLNPFRDLTHCQVLPFLLQSLPGTVTFRNLLCLTAFLSETRYAHYIPCGI